MPQVGSTLATTGPANALMENTLDNSSPPDTKKYNCPASALEDIPTSVLCGNAPAGGTIYQKPKWDGGNPATWTGQADFHVEAPTPRSEGGFFKCGASTPCSLVIVPNWGGTPVYNANSGQFSYGNTSLCGQHWLGNGGDPTPSQYKKYKGDLLGDTNNNPSPGGTGDIMGGPVTGSGPYAFGESSGPNSGAVTLLQGASYACWTADRIVIPLSFAPTPADCPNKTPAFYAQGSPMMQTQMLQWQAGWCNGPEPVTLDYTSNSESVARGEFLAGTQPGGAPTDMALVTLPATAAERQGSQRQFTYAPLANSGVGIAYLIDDPNNGAQINRIVLDPRLLAKLVTESYTLLYGCTAGGGHKKPSPTCDPAVWGTGKNAFSLFDDPEFLSLNRHCQPYGEPANYTCSNQQNQQSATDDFPTDTSATDGTGYGDFLPSVLEPDSDMTYDLSGWIAANSDAAKFLAGKPDPWGMRVNSNYLNVAYPTSTFPILDNGYTQRISCSPTNCSSVTNPDVTMQAAWTPQINLPSIAEALLTFQPTALSPVPSCPVVHCTSPSQLNKTTALGPQYLTTRDLLSELDLGDIAGYQFPAAELVNAAGKAVGPTQASVEAAVSDMKTNPDGITQYFDYATNDPAAYPLATVDYAMVPTCGLSSAKASAIADFLTKVATTGQTQGGAPGDLAPGYYPLNANQKAQTLQAAQEVKAQTCTSQSPQQTSTHPATHQPTASPSASPSKTPAGSHPSPTDSPISRANTMAFGEKSADSGMAGLLLQLAVLIGVLLMLGGPAVWVITVTGRWPVVFRGARAAGARLQRGLGRVDRRT